MTKLLVTATFALAMCAVVPSVATAQTNASGMSMMGGSCPMMGMMGQGGSGQRMMSGSMMGGNMMGTQQSNMSAMADTRLADLKGKLKITGPETEAWNSYADAVKARVETMQGVHATMMTAMKAGSAVDRMNARISSMQAMVDAMKAVSPAITKLYSVLTVEQRTIADKLIGMDCGAM